MVAVVRYVYNEKTNPQVGVAFPLIKDDEMLGTGFSGIQVGLGLSVEVEAFGRALVS